MIKFFFFSKKKEVGGVGGAKKNLAEKIRFKKKEEGKTGEQWGSSGEQIMHL